RWARPPQDLSADVIRAVLKRTRGNRSEAANILGVGRTTLWRAMKRMGID
ncbi:MAG: sigma-54-dependent Fis family transcriptional regulator, partial [Candidatus Hydrogenedentes bacterium]|nr:sigma-54-dependent Fis family transcriptional regulator [Candidatus Hydrogenedentota bacterium]